MTPAPAIQAETENSVVDTEAPEASANTEAKTVTNEADPVPVVENEYG